MKFVQVLWFGLCLGFAWGQPELETLQRAWQSGLVQHDKAFRGDKDALDQAYLGALTRMLSRARSPAQVEAVEAEVVRFQVRRPATAAESSADPAVARMQTRYAERVEARERQRAQEVLRLAGAYRQRLDALVNDLIRHDRLLVAKLVANERDELETHSRVVEARRWTAPAAAPEPGGMASRFAVPERKDPAGLPALGGEPGREGVSRLEYTTQIKPWAKRVQDWETVKLGGKPPDRTWVAPNDRHDRAWFGTLKIGNAVLIKNVTYQVKDRITGWFAFNRDFNFGGKVPHPFKVVSGEYPKSRLLEFPLAVAGQPAGRYGLRFTLSPGTLNYALGCGRQGAVNLAGANHPVILFDLDVDGTYADLGSGTVYLRDRFTDREFAPRPGQPFFINHRYYKLKDVTPAGTAIRFLPCELSPVRGRITDVDSGEPVAGAVVRFPAVKIIGVTDTNGQYEVELPVGDYAQVQVLADRFLPNLVDEGGARVFRCRAGTNNAFSATLKTGRGPMEGVVKLRPGDSYHFLSGVRDESYGGDFTYALSRETNKPEFRFVEWQQRGIARLGESRKNYAEVDLEAAAKSLSRSTMAAVEDHLFVSRARYGEFGHWIVFRVMQFDPTDGTLQVEFLYR